MQVNTLLVMIVVRRLSTAWITGAILPVVMTVWLSFIVFFMDKNALEQRLGKKDDVNQEYQWILMEHFMLFTYLLIFFFV